MGKMLADFSHTLANAFHSIEMFPDPILFSTENSSTWILLKLVKWRNMADVSLGMEHEPPVHPLV